MLLYTADIVYAQNLPMALLSLNPTPRTIDKIREKTWFLNRFLNASVEARLLRV